MRRRDWLGLAARVARLLIWPTQDTCELVRCSYDRVADGYDEAWTHHMRAYSLAMLDRLNPGTEADCLDLTCGTGFVAAELARRTGGTVTGVDASGGMLGVARQNCGERCTLIQADVAEYLRRCPRNRFDIVTCAWGLGYSQPWTVVHEAKRVLRPGGRIGIVDNTLFSLSNILWASVLAFAESPQSLVHVMRVRFLPGSWVLPAIMRATDLAVQSTWDGAHTYYVPDGQAALGRLTANKRRPAGRE